MIFLAWMSKAVTAEDTFAFGSGTKPYTVAWAVSAMIQAFYGIYRCMYIYIYMCYDIFAFGFCVELDQSRVPRFVAMMWFCWTVFASSTDAALTSLVHTRTSAPLSH